MSEYQYYEFLAIDRPLTRKQMDEVREYSSRATITPSSFVNEYHWGNFRGDERKFLRDYYDAMLYVANWGTHQFMFRVPAGSVDLALAKAYCADADAQVSSGGGFLLFDFVSDDDGDDWDGDEDGGEWMSTLSLVRQEVLAGDLRALYLAWLKVVQSEGLDDDLDEPPVPDGLASLSAAQLTLAQFLRIDDDLIAVAARASAPLQTVHSPELAAWVVALPQQEKDEALAALVGNTGAQILKELRGRFLASRAASPQNRGGSGRNVGQLLAEVERLAAERKRAESERKAVQRAQKQAAELKARADHLAALANRPDRAWAEIESLIGYMTPKNYDQAITLLKDLQEVSHQSGETLAFAAQVAELLKRHVKKATFRGKLAQAGITPNPQAC